MEALKARLGRWVAFSELSQQSAANLNELRSLRALYAIDYDHAPVMDSDHAFAAKIQPALKTITLNNRYLEKIDSADRALVEEFLIWHELAHALESDEILPGDIESFCDSTAFRAILEFGDLR